MLQFAVGFFITPSCRGGRSKPKMGCRPSQKQNNAKKQVPQKQNNAKKQVPSPWVSVNKRAQMGTPTSQSTQAEGGGWGKQPDQKQGIKRMPKTRVHSTLCKVLARSQPTLTTQELQFYSWSRELMMCIITILANPRHKSHFLLERASLFPMCTQRVPLRACDLETWFRPGITICVLTYSRVRSRSSPSKLTAGGLA